VGSAIYRNSTISIPFYIVLAAMVTHIILLVKGQLDVTRLCKWTFYTHSLSQ